MSVFHHVIKSLGTRYDPMAGSVIAHVVGGGSVGNTTFYDLSPLETPVVAAGSMAGAAASGPFGSVVSIKPGAGNAGVVLAASDNRYRIDGGMSYPFTIDGWVRLPARGASGRYYTAWSLHTTGAVNGGTGASDNHLYLQFALTSGATTAYLYGSDSNYAPVALATSSGLTFHNQWVYVHAVVRGLTNITLRVHSAAAATSSGLGWFPNKTGNYSFTFGALAGGFSDSARLPVEVYAMRVTKAERPFVAALLTSPWPEAGGTQNWLGDPAGVAGQPGQRELTNGQAWTVPPGVTQISAVAVGCKLSIAGTDVLAATWPVLGDGGGQGGAGGTGHSSTVVSWSNGPPTASFGGGSGTVRSTQTYYYYGGGGGAGGYTGNGGNGVNTRGATVSVGQGGGGGGGATKAWGGGVGLKGQGASGTGGSNPGQPGSANGTTYGGGKPGSSGGTLNGTPGNNLAWRNNIPVTQGQVVLCTYIGESGQTGAARIMWGDDRSFPNDAGDVE